MQDTKNYLQPIDENECSSGEMKLLNSESSDISGITLAPRLDESLGSLKKEGLTSLQQLNRSGNLLIESMEKVLTSSSELNVMEVVECAKALGQTVQVQANLLKVLREFSR